MIWVVYEDLTNPRQLTHLIRSKNSKVYTHPMHTKALFYTRFFQITANSFKIFKLSLPHLLQTPTNHLLVRKPKDNSMHSKTKLNKTNQKQFPGSIEEMKLLEIVPLQFNWLKQKLIIQFSQPTYYVANFI